MSLETRNDVATCRKSVRVRVWFVALKFGPKQRPRLGIKLVVSSSVRSLVIRGNTRLLEYLRV